MPAVAFVHSGEGAVHPPRALVAGSAIRVEQTSAEAGLPGSEMTGTVPARPNATGLPGSRSIPQNCGTTPSSARVARTRSRSPTDTPAHVTTRSASSASRSSARSASASSVAIPTWRTSAPARVWAQARAVEFASRICAGPGCCVRGDEFRARGEHRHHRPPKDFDLDCSDRCQDGTCRRVEGGARGQWRGTRGDIAARQAHVGAWTEAARYHDVPIGPGGILDRDDRVCAARNRSARRDRGCESGPQWRWIRAGRHRGVERERPTTARDVRCAQGEPVHRTVGERRQRRRHLGRNRQDTARRG